MADYEDDTDVFEESDTDPVQHSIEIAPKETGESMMTLNAIILFSIVGMLVAWMIFRRSRQGSQQYTSPDSVGFPRIFPS